MFIVNIGVCLFFVEGGWLLCLLPGSGNKARWLLHNGFKLSPGIVKVHHLLLEYRPMLIPARLLSMVLNRPLRMTLFEDLKMNNNYANTVLTGKSPS